MTDERQASNEKQEGTPHIKVTPEMVEAGERVLDEWSVIEPPFALARRVYIAMARIDVARSPCKAPYDDARET